MKMYLAFLFLLNYLPSITSRNIVLIITDDQDSVLDGMVAPFNFVTFEFDFKKYRNLFRYIDEFIEET